MTLTTYSRVLYACALQM